jgi:NTE family protein/lysophospholipid hydrolase
LEQTDRIVVASRPETTSEIERIDRTFAGRSVAGSPVQVDLILIHEQETELPRGTRPWVELRCLGRHHHVRRGNTADFDRAARRMSGRAVGVVLGGGGARALAHIGALQALEEAGIPVDVIGGTSMGSVMAAAHAMGWPPKRMLETMKQVVPNSKALTDVDFPMVSFLAGRKLRGILEFAFAGVDIVDLWLPYYCISASLNEARMVVHERGPLARSVRASCSLPGIYPPVRAEGQFLVDGGIMNNIPVDIMDGMCRGGTVIAIDVGGGGARNLELGERDGISGWGLLGNRLNPLSANERIASVVQILTWSTTLSGTQYVKRLIDDGYVDLFLRPPVQGFELLGFDAHEKLYEIGYEYTRKQLTEWDGLQRVTIGSSSN